MSLIITSATELQQVAPPALPQPGDDYNRAYQDQLNNVLRLYFNRLNNLLGQLAATADGSGIQLPYGAFSSDQDQTTTANTATLMTLNTTDFANNVSIATSQITTAVSGMYNLQFSTQFQNTDNAIQDISIWLRQNGVDIPGSTGFVSIPAHKSSSPGDEAHEIVGWNYYIQMQANDYVEIWWSTTNASVTIQHYPAPTGPVRPATQSVVATLSFVSSIP